MWQTPTHRFGRYIMLSSLLHLLSIAGVLGYYRLSPQPLPPPEPVNIALAAPDLPDGPALAIGKPLAHALPAPPDPAPLSVDVAAALTVAEVPAPLPDPAPALPPPEPPRRDRPHAVETPLVPVKMPEPTTSSPLLPPAPPVVEPPVLPQITTAVSREARPFEPLAPPLTPLAPMPPQQPREQQPALEVAAVPRSLVSQSPPKAKPAVRARPAMPSPPATPATPSPSAETITPALEAPQAVPAAPLEAPIVRHDTAHMPLVTPTPPAKALPPVSSTPVSTPATAPTSRPTALPQTAATRESALPSPPPPPAGETTAPTGRLPTPPLDSSRPQDVAATPRLTRRTPESSPFESLPHFVHQPKPDYPLMARRRGWEGTVTLYVELRADGTVGDVQVAQSSGYPLLDEAARDTVKTWRHMPVKRDGVPVTRRAQQQLVFKLD